MARRLQKSLPINRGGNGNADIFQIFLFRLNGPEFVTRGLHRRGVSHPIAGGSDLDFSNTANSPKGPFSYVAPAGWTGGGNLIFVDSTTLPNAQAASTVYLTTYGIQPEP